MQRTPSHLPVVLAACALVSAAGCGNPCEAERGSVQKALAHAQSSRADLYAPREMAAAQAAAGTLQEECDRQRRRFFLLRSYRRAQAAANEALRTSETAVEKARAGEGLARQEALNARYEAGMAVNEAVLALRRVEALRGKPEAEPMLGRLDALRLALVELQRTIDRGEPLAAREMGLKIRDEAIRLQAEANRGALQAFPK